MLSEVMMITEHMTAQEVFLQYKSDMEKLIAYLPWLEEKSGKEKVATNYVGQDLAQSTISFPVYDGTLLRFIREADSTQFIDRNYVYVLSRNRLRTVQEEKQFVKNQTMLQLDNIGGILSKYVMGGRTKSRLWSEAVDQGVFLEIVSKLKELYDLGLNGLTN